MFVKYVYGIVHLDLKQKKNAMKYLNIRLF
jgi:hypothetical protein